MQPQTLTEACNWKTENNLNFPSVERKLNKYPHHGTHCSSKQIRLMYSAIAWKYLQDISCMKKQFTEQYIVGYLMTTHTQGNKQKPQLHMQGICIYICNSRIASCIPMSLLLYCECGE